MTLEQLLEARNELDRKIKAEFGVLKKRVDALDVENKRNQRNTGWKVPPKYQCPHTGNTWAGRGKEPSWIKGKDRAEFLIGG